MLSQNPTFLSLDQSCDEAVAWLAGRLRQEGLSLVRTFDLQVARQAQIACPCPHHGTEQCDCQMVVLLVYAASSPPLALIAHGYNGQTWFSIVDTPQQPADPHLETHILKLIDSPPFPSTKLANSAHAI